MLANRHRPDLAAAIGDDRSSFAFPFPVSLSPLKRHVIAVRREGDGTHLRGSPREPEASTAFDPSAKEAIARLLAAGGGGSCGAPRLFLGEQADRLRQRRADDRSGAAAARSRRVTVAPLAYGVGIEGKVPWATTSTSSSGACIASCSPVSRPNRCSLNHRRKRLARSRQNAATSATPTIISTAPQMRHRLAGCTA